MMFQYTETKEGVFIKYTETKAIVTANLATKISF